jgi:hypothetical protein
MEHRSVRILTMTVIAAFGVRTASADPIAFTGNVANDFSPSSNTSVQITQVDSDPTNNIYQLPEMTAQGLINGWAIKDIRTVYDAKTDTLSVGVNTYSIAGSAIGAGGSDIAQLLASKGGSDPADLGGRKSITIAFASNNPDGTHTAGPITFVAGVPADKSTAGSGIDGFNVASFKGIVGGIQNNYGATLTNNMGALAFNPDAAHPNFEFTITNFSQAPGMNPSQGFWIKAYAGSPDDAGIGEEQTAMLFIPAIAPQSIPEPTTLMGWGVAIGGAGWWRRRRARRRSR